MPTAAHENLQREQHIEGASDRGFGLVFAAFFMLIAASPLVHAQSPRWWALLLAVVFGTLAAARPSTPLGLAMRPAGKDPLRLKFDAAAQYYWIARRPPGPPPGSLTNEF